MLCLFKHIYFIVFSLCFVLYNSYLVKVIEITRHGARTPLSLIDGIEE